MGTVVVPTVTGTSWILLNAGFPKVTAVGPNCVSAATPGLLGNAACSSWSPVASGVSEADDEKGAPEVRKRSKLADPKNQILSRLMGPPTVPPNWFCTKKGTTGAVQPVEGLTPGGQKPRRGDFSWFCSE